MPGAAVIEQRVPVTCTLGLLLGQRHVWEECGHVSSSGTPVPAHAVNVHPIVSRVSLDLEDNLLAKVHTKRVREALTKRVFKCPYISQKYVSHLNGRVSIGVDIPLPRVIAGSAVLSDDLIAGADTVIRADDTPDARRGKEQD